MATRPRRPDPAVPAPAAPDSDPQLRRVRRLAHLLDNSIPLPGGFRVGLDALIGLIPGIGDTAGAVLSAYVLAEAQRLGAPRSVLLRMAANVAVETIVGAIPFVGDLFDAGWKANARNVRLLNAYLERPATAERTSRGFLMLLLAGLALLFVGAVAVAILIVRAIAGAF
ncbi:MAG TPA: DUF4112 domain-containing protein [Longimicrobiaceae bacterium]|nr:DUF4112 domain-containing protein [Longimicrobiaceae bacterium]